MKENLKQKTKKIVEQYQKKVFVVVILQYAKGITH